MHLSVGVRQGAKSAVHFETGVLHLLLGGQHAGSEGFPLFLLGLDGCFVSTDFCLDLGVQSGEGDDRLVAQVVVTGILVGVVKILDKGGEAFDFCFGGNSSGTLLWNSK